MAVKTIKELLAQVDEVGSGYCSFLGAMPKYKVVSTGEGQLGEFCDLVGS